MIRPFAGTATLALLALLLLTHPQPIEGQRTHVTVVRSESRVIEEHGSRRFEVRFRGGVTPSDAGDWIEALAPGAEVVVEERDGGRSRRAEFTPGPRGVEVRFLENGRVREVDAPAREWIGQALLRATREGGIGLGQRVERLRARGGAAAVLREAGEARSDAARRRYLTALFAGAPLSAAELRQTLAFVERGIGRDTDRRLVLTGALEQGRIPEEGLQPLFAVVERMESDTDRRLVLNAAVERGLVRGRALPPFFRALDRMRSDTDRRLVLTRLVGRAGAVPLPEAFFSAVEAMESGTDRRLVLSAVLRADPPEATTLAAIRSAGRLRGDTDRRLVLAQVPASQLRTPRIAAAYREAAERIGSPRDRELALRRLAGSS